MGNSTVTTPSNLERRARALRDRARAKAAAEMIPLRNAQWYGQVAAQQNAIRAVSTANTLVNRLLDGAKEGDAELSDAELAFATVQLDLAESVLNSGASTELRVAHLQGYHAAVAARRGELEAVKGLSPAEAAKKLNLFVEGAKSTSELLKKLAEDPRDFYLAGAKILEQARKYGPGFVTKALPSLSSSSPANPLLGSLDDMLSSNKAVFEGAAKWLGRAAVCVTVVTGVFKALADEGHWATHVSQAVVAAGSGVALGAVITGSAVGSAIAATFASAGMTVEVPPVAAVLLAAGIVLAAGVAIAKLYDSIVTLLFGSQTIPRSMRLSMTSAMYADMSTSMSKGMAASMVSLPH